MGSLCNQLGTRTVCLTMKTLAAALLCVLFAGCATPMPSSTPGASPTPTPNSSPAPSRSPSRVDGRAELVGRDGSVVAREGEVLDDLGGGNGADNAFHVCIIGG
jgi:hypothetical protein